MVARSSLLCPGYKSSAGWKTANDFREIKQHQGNRSLVVRFICDDSKECALRLMLFDAFWEVDVIASTWSIKGAVWHLNGSLFGEVEARDLNKTNANAVFVLLFMISSLNYVAYKIIIIYMGCLFKINLLRMTKTKNPAFETIHFRCRRSFVAALHANWK